MERSILRTSLWLVLLGSLIFAMDALVDRWVGGMPIAIPHIIFAGLVITLSVYLMIRSLQIKRHSEELAQKTQAELEVRVTQRTAELKEANISLQHEVVQRELAQQERERLIDQMESSRLRAESLANELQMANKMLFALIDTLPVGMIFVDKLGRLILANANARIILGSDEPQGALGMLEGHPNFCRLDGKPIEREELPLYRAIHLGQTTLGMEIRMCKESGHISYMMVSASPVYDENGVITSAVEIVLDITDRVLADEAVRISEEKFSTVFQYSPDPIVIVRISDGSFLEVNPAFCQMLGKSRSQIVGTHWLDLKFISSFDDQQELRAQYQRNSKITDYELDLEGRNGELITLLVSLIPISINSEACVLALAHDITERQRSEIALRMAQAELERETRERTTLQERQRLARELHDSVSQALYGISLGAHTANSLFDSDREKVREAISYVLTLAQAGLTEMRALIFELRPESLELEGLVNALTKQTAAVTARHGIEVRLNLCEEPDLSLMVKEALYRIAQEAIQNSVKHSRTKSLEVNLRRTDTGYQLEVCDKGVGFNADAIYPGHLGLRSMQERAANIGGQINITSKIDVGTKIQVCVPGLKVTENSPIF